jgi:hypothetical protein
LKILAAVVSIIIICIILHDAFETIILPRRVSRRFRFTRRFYRLIWLPWRAVSRRMKSRKRREVFLGYFGPLSLILLFSTWASGMFAAFAVLQWALNSPLKTSDGAGGFGTYLYMSGTTFFTLGFGDVTPEGQMGRALAVIEAGLGFGFLALTISYLPVIYQAFSRREANISLLDARAGSPPCAEKLLRHHGADTAALDRLLLEWERWSADLMESHISYPVLCYYRSQHSNQSWLGALTAILDTSALVLAGVDGVVPRQAQLTFAIARHALVDLAETFRTPPDSPQPDRLPPESLKQLRSALADAGVRLREGADADQKLAELRGLYEPFVNALAKHLLIPIPPWVTTADRLDNWQISAWDRISARRTSALFSWSQDDEHP